jgi:1-acyl-sn-glycerol-3-phosphate acyltransferase
VLGLFRWGMRRLAGIRVTVEGRDLLPERGGYILACAAHRSWFDGPLLPSEFVTPRLWYIASAVSIFKFPGLEWFLRRFGGMVPVYRGGTDLDVHIDAARAIIDAGAVFAIYPEGGRAGDGDRIAPFRRGVGLIALRTGAPIVPVALGGTKELYRGRRVYLRVLPPTTALKLAGLATAPVPGTPAELEAARHATEGLALVLAPHVTELARRAEDPPSHPRRWRWLTGLFATLALAVVIGACGATGSPMVVDPDAIVVPTLLGPWRPDPIAIPPAIIEAADRACRASIPFSHELELAVLDARGKGYLQAHYAGAGGREATCLNLAIDARGEVIHEGAGGSGATSLPPIGPGELRPAGGMGLGRPRTMTMAVGRAGSGIAAVVLDVPGYGGVRASLANGWYVAWWPGLWPDGTVVRGLDQFGNVIADGTP